MAADPTPPDEQRRHGLWPVSVPESRLYVLYHAWSSSVLPMLQTMAIPFAFYFKPVIVFLAMSWYVPKRT